MKKNNIIDLTPFIKESKKEKNSLSKQKDKMKSPPLSITSLRQKTIYEERRQVKRSIFREFIHAQAVIPSRGLLDIFLQNISENGVAFDIEEEKGRFKKGELVHLRIYITLETYLPFTVKVKHIRAQKNDGLTVYRHGASFVKEALNEKALVYFAKFIENATAVLRTDKGDIKVSGIVD